MTPASRGGIRVRYNGWDCRVVFARYADGHRVACDLYDVETGEPVARATVNMPEIPLMPDEVLVKDYAENAGMLEALVAAGLVADTGRRHTAGYAVDGVAAVRLLVDPGV